MTLTSDLALSLLSTAVFGFEITEDTITIAGSLAVVVLIALSGFFSSSEIAMFSLGDHKVDAMVAEGLPGAELVQALKADPHRLLVTILVGNNIVNIAMSSIATTVLAYHLPPAQSVLVATFGITALVLLFGESAPKSYAVEHTESWARRIARPLKLSEYLMYPLVVVFDALTRLVNRVTGSTGELEAPYVTRDEIQQMIDTGEREGIIEEDEREMLRGVFQFRNRIAKEVMVPRLEIVAVPTEASVSEAIDVCVEEGRDRIPVYKERLDEVLGIVELPDLIAANRRGEEELPALASEAMFVPESKNVDELLAEMREARVQMVIVIDEFGATQGLVTLEDIIEEVVGEILEETEHEPIERIDEGSIRVRGEVNVHEVNEELEIELPEGGEFETIAGFVFAELGRIPDSGETIEHEVATLTVERVDNTRITAILVERRDREEDEETRDGVDGE
jgi:putative hemolysin